MRKFLSWATLWVFCVFSILPVCADSTRINQAPDYPARQLILQFNTGADSLYDGDPNSGNLTTTSATGKGPVDGLLSVALSSFTPTATLTSWYYNTAELKWVHCGATAAEYSKAFTATYTMAQFAVPPGCAYILTADVHITTHVYVSGRPHKDNANSAAGF